MTDVLEPIDFEKGNGLVPVIVQDAETLRVLMLGYMNEQALTVTRESGFVTFFSRSKNRLWQKGETSGNRLKVVLIAKDCDSDALLVLAEPQGPTCHTGAISCFTDAPGTALRVLEQLADTIRVRKTEPPEKSYTASLFAAGLPRMAQKVGEEGVEVALAATTEREKLPSEAADLLYHLLVLLEACDLSIDDALQVLRSRRK